MTKNLKREFSIPENVYIVGSVGRLGKEKDYFTLLDVAKIVNKEVKNIYFMIVGDGKKMKEKDFKIMQNR